MFSITSSIITVVIDNIIKFIFFKNSISDEAIRKNKILIREIRKENKMSLGYEDKLKRGFSKLKVIISLVGKKHSKNLIANENNLEYNTKKYKDNIKKINEEYFNRFLNIKENESGIIPLRNNTNNSKINISSINFNIRMINREKYRISKYEKSNLFEKENIIEENKLNIQNIENFQINAKLVNRKIKRKYTVSESSYISKSNKFYGTSKYNLKILCLKNESNLISKLRSNFKTIIIFCLFFVLWFFDLILLQSIYEQFGSNILKICFYPFITMIIVKKLIIVKIMILLNTFILFYFGKYLLILRKKPIIIYLIVAIFVPPSSLEHYSALITYLYMIK